jgi:hypothetical protein
MNYEIVEVQVDDATIAEGDLWKVIDPVWWSASIYDGAEEYDRSLRSFSRSQRLLFAALWYQYEVDNGGHKQFYFNSTGIVWKDALEAFKSMGLTAFEAILRESAERLGGSPSLDREERNSQLDTVAPDFDDLDERFYEADEAIGLDDRLKSFMRSRPSDFYFRGKIRRPLLAGSNGVRT